MNSFQIVFLVVVLFVLVSLVWRLVSNRKSLPCPSLLGWMVDLDNPFTETNRASVIIALLSFSQA